ncbi:hypothetical protein OROGR_007733 [Orobanche gracilis]
MKFGKELASQMVQEWQGAYMDYNHLKILLKDLLTFRQQHKPLRPSPDPPSRPGSLKRRLTMYRAFSGLTARSRSLNKGNEDEVILVSAVPNNEGSQNYYQTTFLRLSEEGGQQELLFFRKLDDEFNKVVKFYKAGVEEAEMKADDLSKQMDTLIALRIKVDKPNYVEQKDDRSQVKVGSDSNGNSGPATVIASVSGVNQD